jgi:hypothetical protein
LNFVILMVVFVGTVSRCDGGVTSKFQRKLEATEDMPFDSDVFRAPAGYNAPQQVLDKTLCTCTRNERYIASICNSFGVVFDLLVEVYSTMELRFPRSRTQIEFLIL